MATEEEHHLGRYLQFIIDIKATNILLDIDMRARIADFGFARQSRENESHSKQK